MRTRGPIITLLSVVCLAIVMLALNMTVGRDQASEAAAAARSAAPPPPPGSDRPPTPVAGAFPTHGTYSGRTSGRKAGEATVAISIRDGQATAYLCDNKKLDSWLEGPVNGASLALHGSGSTELTAQLTDGKVTGRASVDGASWPFSAEPGEGTTPARPNATGQSGTAAGRTSAGRPAGYAASGAKR
jgi:hypothetical protein